MDCLYAMPAHGASQLSVTSVRITGEICSTVFRQIKRCSFRAAYCWMEFVAKSFVFTSFAKIIEFGTLLNYLNPKVGDKVCDLGCGYGSNDILLSLTGARIFGADIDRETLVTAKMNAARLQATISYCVSNLNNGICFKSESFDKAVSYCVLEHLGNPEQFLNEVNRILRPGGTLALSADSFSYRDIPKEIRDIHRDICHVKKYYTKKDARELLHRCNFSITKCSYSMKSPISGMLFKILLRSYFRSERFGKSCYLWLFKLLTPIVLFVCTISDNLHNDRNGGYWLTLVAVKEK